MSQSWIPKRTVIIAVSLFLKINVDKQFPWAEYMAFEEEKDHDDDDHWIIVTYARSWRGTIHEEYIHKTTSLSKTMTGQ